MIKISSLTNVEVPKKICSIDASTNSLAFAIFDNEELETVGKINFFGVGTYNKVSDACAKTRALFTLFDVEAVVIEHTVFINSPKTAADLALVQGALLGGMALSGVKIIKSTNPMAWQGFIGNSRLTSHEKQIIRSDNPGKSDSWYKNKEREFRKERTIKFVNTIYDKNITDNDVADAIGIGHYAVSNWSKLTGG
jgi:Holliday junction resolvasome RuvABC endonuclease subunit